MFQSAFLPNFTRNTSKQINYLLEDDFRIATPVLAPAVNGTLATDGVNVRTVTDTNNKISIYGNQCSFLSGSVANVDGLWYPPHVRGAGKVWVSSITIGRVANDLRIGIDVNNSGVIQDGFRFISSGSLRALDAAAATKVVGTYDINTKYDLAMVERLSGYFTFIRGGAFTNWSFLYPSETTSTATIFPGISSASSTCDCAIDFMKVANVEYLVSPIASDSFNRANGSIGNTDGLGAFESGGDGVQWINEIGSWNISGNVASAATLSSSLAVATVNLQTPNVHIEVDATRFAGEIGLIVRYLDASNFIKLRINSSAVIMEKVIGGVSTSVSTTAVTYTVGARLEARVIGNTFHIYYNNAFVKSNTVTDASLQSGTKVGLYANTVGNTINNFVAWDLGDTGVYNSLDQFIL
ncbi:MAG: hypothetical protein IPL32_18150 [Chloracidobacterium sp.]|nr:hypothetical protein [Chloracidobacterium sp.]